MIAKFFTIEEANKLIPDVKKVLCKLKKQKRIDQNICRHEEASIFDE